MDDRSDLEPTVRELADTLEALRSELREPPDGPLGLPRPPSPRELLRLTEQYTIPAVIALLETNIRLLELLAAAIRVADGRPLDAASGDDGLVAAGGRTLVDASRDGAEGLAATSRATLQRLDDALADLQSAVEGGEADDPEVQRLLSEARALRAEVDDRLRAVGTDENPGAPAGATSGEASQTGPGDVDDAHPDDAAREPVDIDVDEELDTLRREADRPDDDPGDEDGDA